MPIPIKNLNEYDMKVLINISDEVTNISNDEIYFELLQDDFNLVFEKIVEIIRKNEKNNFFMNYDERKNFKSIENNFNKISSSIIPIFLNTENDKLINIMDQFLNFNKNNKQNREKLNLLDEIIYKKNLISHNSNELKKYELLESLIDDENSDVKIQEILKRTIEDYLKEKIKK